MIQERIAALQQKISSVCRRAGRSPGEITLVAVTKFADLSAVQSALAAGLTHFGENKVQEAQKKFPALRPSAPQITCHMIGHLQINKVKAALEVFDLIQSVDSVRLLEAIDRQAEHRGRDADILVQVNTAGEEQKFGMPPAQLLAFLDQASRFRHTRVQGLMTIAPLTDDTTVIRRAFADLRQLSGQTTARFQGSPNIEMRYLSMGMTHDFEIALEEGANMLRIGTAIFTGEKN